MLSSQITATDPVCGMTVDPGGARRSEHAGQSYFFCSAGCQTKFEADPVGALTLRAEKNAAKKPAAMEAVTMIESLPNLT